MTMWIGLLRKHFVDTVDGRKTNPGTINMGVTPKVTNTMDMKGATPEVTNTMDMKGATPEVTNSSSLSNSLFKKNINPDEIKEKTLLPNNEIPNPSSSDESHNERPTVTQGKGNYVKPRISMKALIALIYASVLLFCSSWGNLLMVYVAELKMLLHYSQTSIELVTSINILGNFSVCPFYYIYTRLGFYGTSLICLLESALGIGLMVVAAHYPNTFSEFPIFVAIFQFLIANAYSMLGINIMQITADSLSEKDSGKALGILAACKMSGQIVATLVYNRFLNEPQQTPLFLEIMFLIVTLSLFLYLVIFALTIRKPPKYNDVAEMEVAGPGINSYGSTNSPNIKEQDEGSITKIITLECKSSKITITELFCSVQYQLFIWACAVHFSLSYLLSGNISLILQSQRLDQYSSYAIVVFTASNGLVRLPCGFVFDWLKLLHRQLFILILSSVASTLSYLIIVIWTDKLMALIISACLMGLNQGVGSATYFATGRVMFGPEPNMIVQSAINPLGGILILFFGLILGITTETEAQCYGPDCYRWTFLGFSVITAPCMFVFLYFSVINKPRPIIEQEEEDHLITE